MGESHTVRFWNGCERYHDLAIEFDQNVEITYPDYVSTNRLAPWTYVSSYPATCVKRYEHRP